MPVEVTHPMSKRAVEQLKMEATDSGFKLVVEDVTVPMELTETVSKRLKNSVKPLVLHVGGSKASEYYLGVSVYYVKQCYEAVTKRGTYRHAIAIVHADGTWSFPTDASDEALRSAEHVTSVDAVARITTMAPDVVIPHMFCIPGMTSYRALFSVLDVPLVGCDPGAMALSTNKAQTRAIVAAAGVRVPEAEVLREGDRPKMMPPFVLKPCNEDNSMGITLYTGKEGENLDECLKKAFSYDSEVLCERFIPLGREVRVAVLEMDDGSLKLLPCTEYFLTNDHPIRTSADKYNTDSNGVPTTLTTHDRKCPADIDDKLSAKLLDMAERSHRALGCKDYSLYDVRIDPDGEPYFLEACLYCSFAPKSVIVVMASHIAPEPMDQSAVFEMLVNRAVARKQGIASHKQFLGIKAGLQ